MQAARQHDDAQLFVLLPLLRAQLTNATATMGIHRLLHHMQDFGSPVELGTAWQGNSANLPTEDLDKKYIVVDGPSLAYHAYHRAVAGRYHARNALEAMPSHDEVAAIAADFLATFEAHNISMYVNLDN